LRLSRAGAGSGVQQQPSDGMMKSMAAFEHLAVANVASIDFCSGSGGANADNQFRGDKPFELMIY